MKVVVAHVDVLGTWTQSWKPGKFKGARVILEDLAIYVGLCIDYFEFMLPHFLDKFHEKNYVTKGHRLGYVFSFCRGECNL